LALLVGELMIRILGVVAIWLIAFCPFAFSEILPPVAATSPPTTDADRALVTKTVKQCVDLVHADKSEPDLKTFFEKFDAFYNLASGRVENNATRNGDQRALFVFKKCMNEKGIPIN
jgi:hypothetical protein